MPRYNLFLNHSRPHSLKKIADYKKLTRIFYVMIFVFIPNILWIVAQRIGIVCAVKRNTCKMENVMNIQKLQNIRKLTYICLSFASLIIPSNGQAGICFSTAEEIDEGGNGNYVSLPERRGDITNRGQRTATNRRNSKKSTKGLLESAKEYAEKTKMLETKHRRDSQKATELGNVVSDVTVEALIPKKAQPLVRRFIDSQNNRSPRHVKLPKNGKSFYRR
jgi:hypothetical protein